MFHKYVMLSSRKTIKASVNALLQDPLQGSTAVLLESRGLSSLLPIWVGLPEALAISYALSGRQPPRPLTHQLLLNSIKSLDGLLENIEVTRIQNNTYFAVLHVKIGSQRVMIDARPSDAIALALNAGVPILVSEDVWATSSVSFEHLGIRKHAQAKPHISLKVLHRRLRRLREREAGGRKRK